MKKIASACLCVTLHFIPDKRLPIKEAVKKVEEEVLEYKKSMDENQIIYDQQYFDDGSIVLYVRKKVKDTPIGNYFNKKLI